MKLRKAQYDDMIFLFDLRNDIEVRRSAFNTEPVNLETHRKWLKGRLKSAHSTILIAEENNNKIGQIRFDIDIKKASAEVSIAIASGYRGKGYGVELLKAGCMYAFQNLGVREIIAYIKEENLISIKAFSKAGFSNLGPLHYKGHRCVKMLLSLSS